MDQLERPASVTDGGHATIYLHGQPGSADELALFGTHVARNTTHWQVLERRTSATNCGDHFAMLADRARRVAAGRTMRLIGFSLGGWAALHLAALLADDVMAVDLIATAAPPADGVYPAEMVGKPVFELARNHPMLFAGLTRAQGWGAMVAPALVRHALFAKAQGGDAALTQDVAFRSAITAILRTSLAGEAQAYRREVTDFASGQLPDVSAITAPVTFWHGEADNWAPISLADQLAARLPNVAAFHRLPGVSHYGALAHVLTTG